MDHSFFGIAFYLACRKVDMPKEKQTEPTLKQKQAKFYNSHPSSNPHVQALNAYLKRVNAKSDFAEKTIERVGYPIWNKAQIIKAAGKGSRGATDSVTYTYLPFSEETENIVNASLIIRTTTSDTVTWWVCDWQYYDMPRGA